GHCLDCGSLDKSEFVFAAATCHDREHDRLESVAAQGTGTNRRGCVLASQSYAHAMQWQQNERQRSRQRPVRSAQLSNPWSFLCVEAWRLVLRFGDGRMKA